MSSSHKFLLKILIAVCLGFAFGIFTWCILKCISLGIHCLWFYVPESLLGIGSNSLLYSLIICTIGALIISLYQKNHPLIPEKSVESFKNIEAEGLYHFDIPGTMLISVLLPLIFGGVLGPEAGLVGFTSCLCAWGVKKIRLSGGTLASLLEDEKDNEQIFTESALCATLGTALNSPLFGIFNIIEPNSPGEKYIAKFTAKLNRIYLYVICTIFGILSFTIVNRLAEMGGLAPDEGIKNYSCRELFPMSDWMFFPVLLGAGVIFGLIYMAGNACTERLSAKFSKHRLLNCLIAAFFIAITGYLLPYTRFSGDQFINEMISGWQDMPAYILFLTAGVKLIMINLCFNFGWRGGSIFPVIYSGFVLGFAMASVTGGSAAFCISVCLSGLYGYTTRKPVSSGVILMMFLHPIYLIPMLLSAFIASKIPCPFFR